MAVPDLSAARLKVERAKQHIRDFDVARASFLDSKPYVVRPKFNPENDVTDYILELLPNLPVQLTLLAGDAVHNLRVALDYMAAEFARLTRSDPKNVYFPICESLEKYKAESPGKTKGIPPVVKEEIDKLRPYDGGSDALWVLHKLDITDKHRLLIAVGTHIGRHQVQLTETPKQIYFKIGRMPLKAGDVLGRYPGNPENDKQMDFAFDIAFGEPEICAGEPVVPTLEYFADMVSTILAHFEAKSTEWTQAGTLL